MINQWKIFFAQNRVQIKPPDFDPDPDPDPDPGNTLINPCAISTEEHPRWDFSIPEIWGEDWFREDAPGAIGFCIQPASQRWHSGFDQFWSISRTAHFWCSDDEYSPLYGHAVVFGLGHNSIIQRTAHKNKGFSIRAVRDILPEEQEDGDGHFYVDDYTDGSGNKYDGVKIGDQVWIKKSLKSIHYQNGSPLLTEDDFYHPDLWAETLEGGTCFHPQASALIGNQSESIDIFGRLYNWYALGGLVNSNGYRISAKSDWLNLRSYLHDEYGIPYSSMALPLKSCRMVNHPQV